MVQNTPKMNPKTTQIDPKWKMAMSDPTHTRRMAEMTPPNRLLDPPLGILGSHWATRGLISAPFGTLCGASGCRNSSLFHGLFWGPLFKCFLELLLCFWTSLTHANLSLAYVKRRFALLTTWASFNPKSRLLGPFVCRFWQLFGAFGHPKSTQDPSKTHMKLFIALYRSQTLSGLPFGPPEQKPMKTLPPPGGAAA
jgi:hypothetical protein